MFRSLLILTLTIFAGTSSQSAELIMVEQDGCVYCEVWNEQISPIYPKTGEGRAAPLRRMDLHHSYPAEIKFTRRVKFTPTFVLIEDGQELARIEGYPGEDFFWWLLTEMLRKNVGYEEDGT